MEANGAKMKTVYTVTERGGKSYWTKVGVGFTNRDGSVNLRLDAVPVNGNLQIRDYDPADFDRKSDGENGARARPRQDDFAEALA